jgi:hypothetical protein
MSKSGPKLWIGITAILTVILIVYLFPIFHSKYGLATAILFSLILVFGMLLYYLRGILMSQTKPGKPHDSERQKE